MRLKRSSYFYFPIYFWAPVLHIFQVIAEFFYTLAFDISIMKLLRLLNLLLSFWLSVPNYSLCLLKCYQCPIDSLVVFICNNAHRTNCCKDGTFKKEDNVPWCSHSNTHSPAKERTVDRFFRISSINHLRGRNRRLDARQSKFLLTAA